MPFLFCKIFLRVILFPGFDEQNRDVSFESGLRQTTIAARQIWMQNGKTESAGVHRYAKR